MTQTTSPGGGADTLAPRPTTQAPLEQATQKETIILAEPGADRSIRPFS
jgi:hypothetical protein